MLRLAKEAGVVNAINFNYRYMPLVQQAHQMCVAAGDVGKHALRPGRPADSELIRRVETADADERMPPKGPPLNAAEVAALRRWIEAFWAARIIFRRRSGSFFSSCPAVLRNWTCLITNHC